jgi:hypothetical protein
MKKQADIDEQYREVFRKKLDAFEMPVREEVWNRIETTLDRRTRQKAFWAWIPRLASVAAAAVLLLILFPVHNQNNESFVIKSLLSCIKTERKSKAAKPDGVFLAAKPVRRKKSKEVVFHKPVSDFSEVAQNSVKETDDEKPADQAVKNPEHSQIKENIADADIFAGEKSSAVKNKKLKTGVGLSFGSGGNALAMNDQNVITSNFVATDNTFSVSPRQMRSSSLIEERLAMEDFPEKSYLPPVSFGLSVSRELSDRFSVESGVFYTYLRSNFKNSVSNHAAHLELHYIGVPLNLRVRLLGDQFGKWSVYFSAGGAVEKGVYSHYSQKNIIDGGEIFVFSRNENIDGLQFSVSAAPGFEFRLTKRYGIFIEPKFSYYFDNKQPVSARTERPVVFGLNGGLRLLW